MSSCVVNQFEPFSIFHVSFERFLYINVHRLILQYIAHMFPRMVCKTHTYKESQTCEVSTRKRHTVTV